jgi:hypothetical protein
MDWFVERVKFGRLTTRRSHGKRGARLALAGKLYLPLACQIDPGDW